MAIDRKAADAVYRRSFGAFVYAGYRELNTGSPLVPNWHIEHVCYEIEMLLGRAGPKRLVINLPPRTLKSFIVSVFLPAWMLGYNPGARIICASYSEDLAYKFSRDCRALMETSFYKRLFRTRLNPKKTAEGEFETTQRGYRLATSVGGTLTGRGGDALIVDDPIKANDANSQVALLGANEWFRNTALSRLDEPQNSLVILAMQRLHVDDPSGILIEQGWSKLVLPAIATEVADYVIGDGESYHRAAGELLQPDRDSADALEQLKREMGSRLFAAQYQQNPTPADGNMIKASWLARYEPSANPPRFRRIVLSCDPAGKAGIRNDYTAITVVGVLPAATHVLQVARGHWTVMQMLEQITTLARQWKVDSIIVEDTSSGMGLIQLLKEQRGLNVIGRRSKDDKESRLLRHQGRFEAGRIFLPKEAPWLADFETELLAFPQGRYDDQVDALLQFLDWLSENESYLSVPHVPAVIVYAERGEDRFSNRY